MSGILDSVYAGLADITSQYGNLEVKRAKVLNKLEEQAREHGAVIFNFDKGEAPEDGIIAVDGGIATENLSLQDLIVVGATTGEGAWRPSALMGERISLSWQQVISSQARNDKIAGVIRAALELRILGLVGNVGEPGRRPLRVIDGAFLGNTSEVLYSILDGNLAAIEAYLGVDPFKDEGFHKGVDDMVRELLTPSTIDGDIVAIVKKDSSTVLAREIADRIGFPSEQLEGFSDRDLASRLLSAGEFLLPRRIDSLPQLLSRWDRGEEHVAELKKRRKVTDPQILTELLRGKKQLVERLRPEEAGGEGGLWSTYFKPYALGKFGRAIRLEFVCTGNHEDAVREARRLVALVDADFVEDGKGQEPWCQRDADKEAKQVSQGIRMVRAHLAESVSAEEAERAFSKNYRT